MHYNYKEIAIVCHEANRALCQAFGDDSQLPWAEASEEQRASCVEGVKHHIENPTLSPRESHELWLERKKALGWIYGEEKNEHECTHPCMLPFDELPLEQQAKDYLFAGIVRAMTGRDA